MIKTDEKIASPDEIISKNDSLNFFKWSNCQSHPQSLTDRETFYPHPDTGGSRELLVGLKSWVGSKQRQIRDTRSVDEKLDTVTERSGARRLYRRRSPFSRFFVFISHTPVASLFLVYHAYREYSHLFYLPKSIANRRVRKRRGLSDEPYHVQLRLLTLSFHSVEFHILWSG